jgi:hypothetical protein
MHRHLKAAVALLMWPTLLACNPGEAVAGGHSHRSTEVATDESGAANEPAPTPGSKDVESSRYPWLTDAPDDALVPLESRFPAPESYERIATAEDSFARFLRGLPVRTDRERVYAFDGRKIAAPSAAVIAMDVGDRNLQQCADTAIRLRAEYLWSMNRSDEIAYHFTSGDRSAWLEWADGERFRIRGSRVERVRTATRSRSRANFRAYLDHVFMYAGTRSLRFDSKPAGNVEPGTFFVAPGSPGHAVIVLDVAVSPAGERVALLGQGFMPAQELHVLEDPTGSNTIGGVWWRLPTDGESLDTPSWEPFSRADARQFAETTQ